ncbi:MAG: hypothetical protein IJM30_06260 [Thermoguttaceae bacterium]|nr:hypothetical protein [Thermoguttaceae bacterium]
MDIIRVTTARDLKRFVSLPYKIYANDPNWIAPLDVLTRKKLDRKKNPFFKHGWAQEFIATEGDDVLGRILVSDDSRFNRENSSNVGMFGFFECVNDANVASALLDAGAKVLKEERNRDSLFGPVEFSTNYEYALLVEGFDSPPKIMMPYNPPYYRALLEGWGLKKNRDLYSWYFDESSRAFAEQWKSIVDRLQERHGFTVRPFSIKHFDRDVKRCMEIYDYVRSEWWWGSVSLTQEEIMEYSRSLRAFANPEMVLIAEANGKPVGFSITVPDFNEAAAPLKGSLSWFGIPYLGYFRLMSRVKRARGSRVMVLCVLPEYRKKGVAEKLIIDTFNSGYYHMKFNNAELGWTDENNDKITRVLERVGAKRFKCYRVYQKDL